MRASAISRRSLALRALVLLSVALGTVLFALAKARSAEPLLGLSATFDFFVLALGWVGVLWVFGVFDERRRAAGPTERTLDSVDWHLDSVRERGLPESRAGLVGGLYLSWLVRRDGLVRDRLVGFDDVFERIESRFELAAVLELYDDLGGKLTTGLMRDRFAEFSRKYLDPREGSYFEDLEEFLGSDPLRAEVDSGSVDCLYARIDERYRTWEVS